MIVRQFDRWKESKRRVVSAGWESTRLILASDGMGFSFHITTIYRGAILHMHYRNHLESVYCIFGEGTLTNVDNGEVYEIKPGSLYALDKHDRHILRARTEMQLACVFNPALYGNETHDSSGSYPPHATEIPEA